MVQTHAQHTQQQDKGAKLTHSSDSENLYMYTKYKPPKRPAAAVLIPQRAPRPAINTHLPPVAATKRRAVMSEWHPSVVLHTG